MANLGLTSKAQQRSHDRARNDFNQLIKVGRMQPVPVTGLQTHSGIKTRGAQVKFQVTSLQGVESFVLLRNFSRDHGSAQQIHVWSAKALQTTPQIYPLNLLYMDADPQISGQKAYYWIKVVPVSNKTT